MRLREKPSFADREKVAEFEARKRRTERDNARLFDEGLAQKERDLDKSMRKLRPFSELWWELLASADKLRTRRIELLQVIHRGENE